MKSVKAFWWRDNNSNVMLNFGDEITPYILNKLFRLRPIRQQPASADLACAGSIIGIVIRESCGNKIKIWGSGLIMPLDNNSDFSNLEFCAVRGHKTKTQLGIDRDIPLGDPALLLPLITKPSRIKLHKVGILPHYVDANLPVVKELQKQKGIHFIDVTAPVYRVIREITSCELILSSSLHGLIASDAYAIPNIWTPLSDSLTGGSFKFEDYYSSLGRETKPYDINNFDVHMIRSYINDYCAIPMEKLKEMQKGLIDSFPMK